VLGRAAILELLPHQGRMCLLNRVLAWDAGSILCVATPHTTADHPLRRNGRLAGVCTVELGLQAMALHGALVDGRAAAPGYVASLRDVRIECAFADDLPGPLLAGAAVLARDPRALAYRFEVTDRDRQPVSSGQATVLVPSATAA
jgi:predicted hotdog family 3-hydroxylacyl-ACP dehydratase